MPRWLHEVTLATRNAGIALLLVYRRFVSPLYGDVCRYYPTCSAYGLGAVQQHGLLRGSWVAVRRISRCHPWAKPDFDDVPEPAHPHPIRLTKHGFVVSTMNPKG